MTLKIIAKMSKYEAKEYISKNIQDPFIKNLMEKHYIEGISWSKVASNLGGNNTSDSIKAMCVRYIKKHCQ